MSVEINKPVVVRSYRLLTILGVILLSFFVIALAFYLRFKTARGVVSGLVSDPAKVLDSTSGRTNLIFLGLGGEGHEAPDLTDSMIFVSLSHSTHSITMISLPRDIWVPTLKAKINTAYHYGNEKRVGGGRDLSKSAVSEILGQPVHYALALDFQGFVKAIDAIGGVDLTIDNTFDDFKYPIPGKENVEPESDRYEHLHFDKGPSHMDGTTALKFARSRHAEGDEGTDFARSARQQKIIVAFKDKLFQSQTLLNLDKLKNLFSSLSSSIDTNIKEDEYASFFRFFMSFEKSGQQIKEVSLTDMFVNPKNRTPYGGQWVLVPTVSDKDIQDYVAKNLAN